MAKAWLLPSAAPRTSQSTYLVFLVAAAFTAAVRLASSRRVACRAAHVLTMSRAAGSSGGSSAERGFTVSHQKVALELGFSSSSSAVLAGYTELTIVPTDRHLKTVFLNTRQCGEFCFAN